MDEYLKLAKGLISDSEMSSGQKLKIELGLEELKWVWIRKVINISIPFYIIVYDSRYPNVILPMAKLKRIKGLTVGRVKREHSQEVEGFKLSMPKLLDNYDKTISSRSVIVSYDKAGDYLSKIR